MTAATASTAVVLRLPSAASEPIRQQHRGRLPRQVVMLWRARIAKFDAAQAAKRSAAQHPGPAQAPSTGSPEAALRQALGLVLDELAQCDDRSRFELDRLWAQMLAAPDSPTLRAWFLSRMSAIRGKGPAP